MKKFKTEEEKIEYLTNEANRQIAWEKGLTYTDPKTGETRPTQQALNPRTFEEAYKIAERQLWYENMPTDRLIAKYIKISGGKVFREEVMSDYTPKLDVTKTASEVFIANCCVEGDITIIYQGSPSDVPDHILDTYLCTGDTSYNPSRPFRWYRSCAGVDSICVMTTSKEEVNAGRLEAFNSYLEKLENPQFITMFWIAT